MLHPCDKIFMNFILISSVLMFCRRHTTQSGTPLRLLVGIRFQVYFTALTGLLFTFPSRYLFTIGLQKYLALAVSSAGFLRATRVSKYSRTVTKELMQFRVRGRYPLGLRVPAHSAIVSIFNSPHLKVKLLPYNPQPHLRHSK